MWEIEMKFKIDHKIFEKFPNLTIGVVICKNLNNSGTQEEVQKEIREQENNVRAKYNIETVSQTSKIDVWRKTYSAFGAKPKENKSSVENLYRLVLQGINLRHINKLVDIYNLISLKYMLPVGGEDLDKIKGNVILTFAEQNEPAVLLLRDMNQDLLHPGEVVYKDDSSAICRRWNWREADRTKLTEETQNCLLVIEGLPPVTKEEITKATEELAGLVKKYCQGIIRVRILDKYEKEIEINL